MRIFRFGAGIARERGVAFCFGQVAKVPYALVELLPIAVGGAEDLREAGLQVVVGGEGKQPSVVERGGHEVVVAAVAQLLAAGAVRRAHRRERFRLELAFGGIVDGARVQGVKPCAPVREEASEGPRCAPLFALGEAVGLRVLALGGKPRRGALGADEAGEGLVEGGVVPQVDQAVGEFVEQQFGKLRLGEMDEAGEQRIVEPAQGGIGDHRI